MRKLLFIIGLCLGEITAGAQTPLSDRVATTTPAAGDYTWWLDADDAAVLKKISWANLFKAPAISGTITGTYTLGGTPTFPGTVTLDAEWDTVGKVETVWSANILLETEIDASSELRALMDDETGTGVLVFSEAPTINDATLTGDTTVATVNATAFQIGGVAITPSAAELNYVDGVTSALQTQLNAKANLAGGNTFTGAQVFPSGQALIAPALGTIGSGVGTALTALQHLTVGNDPDLSTEGDISYDANGDVLRAYDGANQVAIARKIEAIQVNVVLPNDLADSERDAFWIWENVSGMSFVVTGWSAKSDTDDTTLNIEEIDADGANNSTVDAVEIATNGTGLFYGSDTTITAGTIENGHVLVLDFDDTDTPGQVKITIYGYYDANVN